MQRLGTTEVFEGLGFSLMKYEQPIVRRDTKGATITLSVGSRIGHELQDKGTPARERRTPGQLFRVGKAEQC